MSTRRLRIALIQATGGDPRSYGLPLAIGCLASYLRARADTIPASLDILPTEKLAEVLDFKPNLVGISSVTSCFNHATAMAAQVKEATGARVIGGGHHVSALPHRLPVCFDAAVIGEGEETLRELIAATAEGGWAPQVLSRIAGLAYRDGGGIIINDRRPLITPLDSLPYPLRTANPAHPDEATVFTSRGCPYSCIFCSSCRHWGRFRAFSAEYVVGEIEHVLATLPGIERIYSLDDLFIVPRERLRRIVELLQQRGLASRLRFRGFVRSNLVDEECCELLARINFREIRFGAESASPRVLERLKLGTASVEDHQRCIGLGRQYGFAVGASYMLGSPGETEEDLRLTYDFIVRNKGQASVDGFYLLTPLPGTPLWDDCLRRGIVSEDMDWSQLNLSFDNPDFEWDNFIYANDAMPRADFVASVRNHGLLIRGQLKLEIGAGERPEAGFLHLDVRPGPHIEYVGDAQHLPFPENSVAQIYGRHVLEHFTPGEAARVVRECLWVLERGGEIHLVVPNMDFHIQQYYTADQHHAQAGFWGWQNNDYDLHKWGYWWETLHNLLAEAGFAGIRNITGSQESHERDPMHLEVRARKPRAGEQPDALTDTRIGFPFVTRREHGRTLAEKDRRIRELEREVAAREAFIQRVITSLPYRVYRRLKALLRARPRR